MKGRYISLSHAAQIIGVSRERMGKLCRDGRVPGAHKIGRVGSVCPVWEIPMVFKILPGLPPGNPNWRKKETPPAHGPVIMGVRMPKSRG